MKFQFPVFYHIFLKRIVDIKEIAKFHIMCELLGYEYMDEKDNSNLRSNISNYTSGKGRHPIPRKKIQFITNIENTEKMEEIFKNILFKLDPVDEYIIINCVQDLNKRVNACIKMIQEDKITVGRKSDVVISKLKDIDSSNLESGEKIVKKLVVLLRLSVDDVKNLEVLTDGEKSDLDQYIEDYIKNTGVVIHKRFAGTYFVYYYSAHYFNVVHCGLLRIFDSNENGSRARLIIGINNIDKLDDEFIKKTIEANDDREAISFFENYKATCKLRYNQRVYLLTGSGTASNYLMKFDFSGTGEESFDWQTLYLNISRIVGSNKDNKYKGGLGLMVVVPHRATPKIRAYRMGVADIKIELTNERMHEILKLKPDQTNRIQINKDDDSEWWNFILEEEAKLYGEW